MNQEILKKALNSLNKELSKKGQERSYVICGGASLLLQDLSNRPTRDVDVIEPSVDEVLSECAESVANKLGLDNHWFNSSPGSLVGYLSEDWKDNTVLVYTSSNLQIFSISRIDLLFSKLWAMCDRDKDIDDLLTLQPSLHEIKICRDRVVVCDANPNWTEWVDENVNTLKKKLGYD